MSPRSSSHDRTGDQGPILCGRLAPRRAGTPREWIELDVETAASTLGQQWRRLNEAPEAPPTGDPTWQVAYWRAFPSEGSSPCVHALRVGEELSAVLPLRRSGRFVQRWSSGANAHTPYCALGFGQSPQVAAGALEHLMASVQMLDLGPLYARRAETDALARAARERGFRVSQDARGADAVIDLPASWSGLQRSLGAKLVGNTSRRLRHLRELGRLEFEVVTGGALPQILTECFALERLGWKGTRGAPISSRPDTLQFYSELAEASAADGRLALYILRLNSALIAFEYCLRHNGRIDLLKESYHPDFSRYSPGSVLRLLLLQREIESGEARSYHMGRLSGWKAGWANRREPLCQLRVYRRGLRGTIAYLVNSWIPGRARQQPVIRAAGRWLLGRLRIA